MPGRITDVNDFQTVVTMSLEWLRDPYTWCVSVLNIASLDFTQSKRNTASYRQRVIFVVAVNKPVRVEGREYVDSRSVYLIDERCTLHGSSSSSSISSWCIDSKATLLLLWRRGAPCGVVDRCSRLASTLWQSVGTWAGIRSLKTRCSHWLLPRAPRCRRCCCCCCWNQMRCLTCSASCHCLSQYYANTSHFSPLSWSHFAWGVAEANCILVTPICVSVRMSVCPSPHSHTTAWTRM